jgi:hypothetical protein
LYANLRTIVFRLSDMSSVMPLTMPRLNLFTIRPNQALLSANFCWVYTAIFHIVEARRKLILVQSSLALSIDLTLSVSTLYCLERNSARAFV